MRCMGAVGAYFRPECMAPCLVSFQNIMHSDLKFEHIFWWSKFSFLAVTLKLLLPKC